MLFGYRCSKCGGPLVANGKFGQPSACRCGQRLYPELADRVRRYWIIQAALPYGAATYLGVLAVLHAELPSNPWERLLHPTLVAPSVASVVVVYRLLKQKTLNSDASDFLFRYYSLGMALAGLGFAIAVIAERF